MEMVGEGRRGFFFGGGWADVVKVEGRAPGAGEKECWRPRERLEGLGLEVAE
jgi:hypothetical protein